MIVAATLVSPCKECSDRCIGCHSTCGEYAEYKQELERRRHDIKLESESVAFQKAVKKRISKSRKYRRDGDDR